MAERHINGLRQRVAQFLTTLSLRARLMSGMSVGSLIATILIAVGIVGFVAQIETAAWRGRQSEAARSAATIISKVLEDAGDSLRFAGLFDRALLAQQPRLLQEMLRQESGLLELVRLDTEGNLIANAFRDESILAHTDTISQSAWFQQARSGKFYIRNVQILPPNHPYLILAMPAPDDGVVAARLKMDVLWAVAADARFGRAGRIYVVDRAGNILAHTDTQIVMRQENIQQRPEHITILRAPQNEWQGEFTNLRGQAVVGASRAVPNADWIAIAELPHDEAFAMTRRAGWLVFGGALIVFFASNMFIRVLATRMVLRPLAELRRGAERIGQGDWSYRIPVHARDEIGQVADAFNRMTERLQAHATEIAARTQSLQMFEKTIETMNLGVTITNVQGDILYVNPADARMHGYTVAELIGKSSRVYMPNAPVIARTREQVKTWSTWQREGINVRKDGSLFPVQIVSDVVRDANGEPLAVVASCLDITERKQAERVLLQASEELEARVRARTLELAVANQQLGVELGERQRAHARQSILYETLRALGAQLDVDNSARVAAETISRLTNYPHVCVALPNQDGTHWVVRGAAGSLAVSIGAVYEIQQGVIGRSFQTGQMQWVRDVFDDPGYVRDVTTADAPALRSEIVVPLRYGGQILGALNIESERVDAFDANDAAMIQSLGDLIALALANARLYEDLRASEERWRSLVTSAPALIATFDHTGSILSTNLAKTPYTVEQMVGTSIYDYLAGNEQSQVRQTIASIFQIGKPIQFESWIIRADGTRKWYENHAAPICQGDQVVAAIVVSLDISERKRAQEALRESEERWRSLVTNAPAIIATFDRDGTIRSINRVSPHRSIEQVIGEKIYALLPPDEHTKVREVLDLVFRFGIPTRYESRITRRDGSIIWYENHVAPIRQNDQVVATIFVSLDISERKRTQEALRESEDKYRQLFELESDALFLIDNTSGEIFDVNASAAALYGYRREELLTMRNTDLSAEPNETRRAMQERHTLIPTRYHRRKDGTIIPVEITASHLTWRGRPAHIAAIRDITERIRAEEVLARRARELALLYETSLAVSAQTELVPLLQTITTHAAELLNVPISGLFVVNPDGETIRLAVAHNFPASIPIGTTWRFGEGLVAQVAQTGEAMAINNYLTWHGRLTHHADWIANRVLAVPLKAHQRVIGVITLADDTRTGAFDEAEMRLVQLFADQAAAAIENARLYDQVQTLAITDELTGLYNRRGLFQFGEREVERAHRFQRPLTAIMFDIDHFKQVNDQYTHAVGDQVLRVLAERARQNTREIDIMGRYGGEEFVWLLPETDLETAVSAAERLRISIQDLTMLVQTQEIRVTVSVGIAHINGLTKDLAHLIHHADQALLNAKAAGRNRIRIFEYSSGGNGYPE